MRGCGAYLEVPLVLPDGPPAPPGPRRGLREDHPAIHQAAGGDVLPDDQVLLGIPAAQRSRKVGRLIKVRRRTNKMKVTVLT